MHNKNITVFSNQASIIIFAVCVWSSRNCCEGTGTIFSHSTCILCFCFPPRSSTPALGILSFTCSFLLTVDLVSSGLERLLVQEEERLKTTGWKQFFCEFQPRLDYCQTFSNHNFPLFLSKCLKISLNFPLNLNQFFYFLKKSLISNQKHELSPSPFQGKLFSLSNLADGSYETSQVTQ